MVRSLADRTFQLRLAGCGVSDGGAHALAEALRSGKPPLRSLNLSGGNCYSESGARALLVALHANAAVTDLVLSPAAVGPEVLAELRELLGPGARASRGRADPSDSWAGVPWW